MDKNIFSGLEDLGFKNIEQPDLFGKKEDNNNQKNANKNEKEFNPKDYLYDKEITCPVCHNVFRAKSVKTGGYRIAKVDSDFFINYNMVNPYFYDVWICDKCGYSAMKVDFEKIKNSQIDAVKDNISKKWHKKEYPDIYDINIAIERFKLALLNYYITGSKASKKTFCCLKLAWMYRMLKDNDNEQLFLNQALEGLNAAYSQEEFPINGMNNFSCMYLLGELSRRVGKFDEANQWFSKVITAPSVDKKIKDMARDQRDLMKNEMHQEEENSEPAEEEKKAGFFSKFFK